MRRHLANFLLLISAVLLTMFLVDRWWQRLSQQAVSCLGCNVIIIDIDTFRADAFDCKGKPGDSGYPSNLCEFVRDAFKFENNFSQSHWTLPSSVSTHTGLYPPEHGVEFFGDILSENSKIILAPEIFQKNNYTTSLYSFEEENFISAVTNTNRGYSSQIRTEDGMVWAEEVAKFSSTNRKFYALFYSAALHSPYILNDDNPLLESDLKQSVFPITQKQIDKHINDVLLTNYEKVFSGNVVRAPKEGLIDFFYSIRGDSKKMEMFIKNSEGKTRDRPIDKWWDIYFSMIHSMYLNIVASFPNAATSLFRIYNANIYEVDNELNLFLDTLVKSDLINNTGSRLV